jgi:hypothetical protein
MMFYFFKKKKNLKRLNFELTLLNLPYDRPNNFEGLLINKQIKSHSSSWVAKLWFEIHMLESQRLWAVENRSHKFMGSEK